MGGSGLNDEQFARWKWLDACHWECFCKYEILRFIQGQKTNSGLEILYDIAVGHKIKPLKLG